MYTSVGHSFHYICSACSWRRGHEKLGGIGQRWLEHMGLVRRMRCRDRNEGEKLRYRLARRENSWAPGFMICWMDDEPIVRCLESAAIRTLRPCANNEIDIERHRLPPGLCGKLPARAPQSILVTYNKTKTRGKHVRPEDNPGSWVWHSDFKSLYTFEQKRLRPYQGPLSLMEDELKVGWPTMYFKARSRRPLLKCRSRLGWPDECRKMKLLTLCEEKASKEQKSAKVYSKYVHDMDTDGSVAVVPDDKTKHAHWMMPVETYEVLLAKYCCTSEHWSFSHMTKQEASECIEEIMNENLPERWKHEFGLGSAKTQN